MITIDYKIRQPIYEQIVERFQTLILKGILSEGSQMPSVRALAMELSINPNTIQKAYALLEQQGYIYPVKGKGNYVAESEMLLVQKQKKVFDEFEEILKKGKDMGIKKERFLDAVQKVYKEVRHD